MFFSVASFFFDFFEFYFQTAKELLINIDFSIKDRLYKGFSINLSASGAFIESSKSVLPNFSPGDGVMLSFEHPVKKEHVKISGSIVRIDKKGIGVMFNQPILEWWTPS